MKVLIIRYGSIGDVLLLTPVVRVLHLQLNATVCLLTKKKYAFVLESNPFINQIFSKEATSYAALKSEKFDLVVDLQKNARSIYLRLILNVSSRAYKKLTLSKWLLLFTRDKRFTHSHVVDRYFETIKHLGVKDDGKGLEFKVGNVATEEWLDLPKKKIVVSMGGSFMTKRIPISLIEDLTRNSLYEFVLIGGQDVGDMGGLSEKSNVRNLIGRTNLNESAALISKCDLVISGDTGMMHLATAQQKPLIVIWGSTSPEFGFSPYYGAQNNTQYISIQNEDLSCRPCSKYGRASCPKGHLNCLKSLTSREIDRAILNILG